MLQLNIHRSGLWLWQVFGKAVQQYTSQRKDRGSSVESARYGRKNPIPRVAFQSVAQNKIKSTFGWNVNHATQLIGIIRQCLSDLNL